MSVSSVEDVEAVVLDNGSCMCRAGIAGDDAPTLVFPAVVGKPRFPFYQTELKWPIIGDEAVNTKGLSISHPMDHGIVTNWDAMELIWDHMFEKININPAERPVLCSEPSLHAGGDREKKCQVMFEQFGVPAFYLANSGILALYSSGRGSGIVLDCGKDVTHWVPVYEGYCLKAAVGRADIGGEDVTRHLADLLRKRGYSFATTAEMQMVREMKEKLCFISEDVNEDLTLSQISSELHEKYTLPDGQTITLNEERFLANEVLFKPSLLGKAEPGLHECVKSCLDNCDMDTRRDFYVNVIINGGTTMARGMPERLGFEVKNLMQIQRKSKIVSPPERKYSVWIGGSILASLSTFQQMWITKAQYEEYGPSIVHRKC